MKNLLVYILTAGVALASAGCVSRGYDHEFGRRLITIETSGEINGTEIVEVYRDGRLIHQKKRQIQEYKESSKK